MERWASRHRTSAGLTVLGVAVVAGLVALGVTAGGGGIATTSASAPAAPTSTISGPRHSGRSGTAAAAAAPAGPGSETSPRTSTTRAGSAPPGTTAPACRPAVATWSLDRLAEQALLVSGSFSDLAASKSQAAAGVGGFVLFGSPAAGSGPAIAGGIAALDAAARATHAPPPWVSTDEEGGLVQRLGAVVGSLPAPRQMAAGWTPAQVTSAVKAVAMGMRRLGVNVDLGPVLDVAASNDPIADESQRSFSAVGSVAATYGQAFAAGLRAGGVLATVKHFPGLGQASADTDTSPASVPPLSADPQALVPFRAAIAAGVPLVMVGHAMVPGLTGHVPASLSAATYRLLAFLGFEGVTMTDDLAAVAISAAGYTEASAAVAALAAGDDLAMLDAAQAPAAVAAIVAAVHTGRLPLWRLDAAVTAILRAKGQPTCIVP